MSPLLQLDYKQKRATLVLPNQIDIVGCSSKASLLQKQDIFFKLHSKNSEADKKYKV